MIPGNVLSNPAAYAPYVYPYDAVHLAGRDYELGPIGLSDPSQGSMAQLWTAVLNGSDVHVSAPTVPDTVIFSRANMSDISLTFDQNAHPFIAFTDNTGSGYWWFDTTSSTQKTTMLPAGSSSPRARLDDKRPQFTNSSDIILTYIRSGKLYYRQQRDRYGTERTLASSVTGTVITRFGMNTGNRLQWELST